MTMERQKRWLEENAKAFAAQAEWHAQNGHPFAEILMGPAEEWWKGAYRRSKRES